MIVAIPSSANNIDAIIDERFARCQFFCFYNIKTKEYDFKENNNRNGSGGVGPKVVEYLAVNGVSEVYATEVGPKAQKILNMLKIRTNLTDPKQTVKQIITNISK